MKKQKKNNRDFSEYQNEKFKDVKEAIEYLKVSLDSYKEDDNQTFLLDDFRIIFKALNDIETFSLALMAATHPPALNNNNETVNFDKPSSSLNEKKQEQSIFEEQRTKGN